MASRGNNNGRSPNNPKVQRARAIAGSEASMGRRYLENVGPPFDGPGVDYAFNRARDPLGVGDAIQNLGARAKSGLSSLTMRGRKP